MSYTFVHRQSTSVRQLAAVADLYGITDPFVNWMRENKLEDVIAPFTLSLRIPEEYVAAWLNAPGERTRYYASGYAAMSLAMQAVLRRLGATLWMDATPEFWTQTRTRAFLVYAASRPYTGRLVHQLTIDHLDKRVMDTYFRHVVRNLPEAKMRFASVLRGLGQRHAAELLRKRDVPRLIATLRDRATELDDLLVLDANAMSSMLKVGVMGSRIHRIWRTRRTRAMPHIPKLPKELKRDLWPRLKRRFGNRHGVALGHILFLEATNVLHGVVAGASGLEASIHVHLPDGTQSFSGSRK